MSAIKIAVLISGGGTNLQAIIDAVTSGSLNAHIKCVISNRKNAFGLERANRAGIEAVYIGKGNHKNQKDRDEALLKRLKADQVDLIVLAGYLDILSEVIIRKYEKRIINIHPSLIPQYCGKGYYGLHVHEAVIENKDTYTGVTVHYVDEGVDTGEIIAQERVEVLAGDSPESLSNRVLKVEHDLLVSVLKNMSLELGGK